MALTTDPDFLAAITFAKAIALAQSKRELTPNLVLAGFLAMLERGSEVSDKSLDSRIPALKDACTRLEVPQELPLADAADIRLPLSGHLRQQLKNSKISVSQFLDDLLEAAIPDDSDDALFDLVVSKTSAWARRRNETEITVDALAAAVFFAFKEGAFVDRPALATHIALFAERLSVLIDQKAWQPDDFGVDSEPPLTLSASLLNSIQAPQVAKLYAIINLGSAAGARIAAQQSTAYHEAGHAVASFMLRPQVPITQVSIIGATGAEGRTGVDANSPYFAGPSSRRHFREQLQILLAGGVAEQLQFGEDYLDAGALSDIERATASAWAWVAQYGLDESFGPISLPAIENEPGYASGFLSEEAQRSVQGLLKTARREARELLEGNWHYVEALAARLLEEKTLGTHEIVEAFLDKSIADWPGVQRVVNRATDRQVRFAEAAGVCQTMEGPVRHEAGDALITGAKGEEWPVSIDKFRETYRPLGATTPGHEGTYRKVPREGLAIELSAPRSIVLSNGRGVLRGRKGDWVIDYGEGDLSLIAHELFPFYYETIV